MNYKELIVEKKGVAVWVTINKPQRKNALGTQTFLELSSLLDEIERDATVVAVVFKGAGDSFCSGIDLKDSGGSGDPADRLAFKRLSSRVFERIEKLSKVVIALVKGYAMAGGLELAMICDIIIADEDAKVGDGHIRTGLIPNGGGSQRLPRLIGIRKAKELLYTGELISGKEAEKIGLVNKAVPGDKLDETAEAYIAKIADKPPLALAAMKLVVDRGMEASIETALELEANAVRNLEATEDFKESMSAFMEKRKPVYKGR
jgi:enoyl-CoA hydratase/carnithine racemase